jgi:predicted alpha/beta-hydrolase family hydrolase
LKSSDELSVDTGAGAVTALAYPAVSPRLGATLILGHGAGAGQRSPFMTTFAQALAALGVDILTFDFPYMQQRRKVPDRQPVLEACYAKMIASAREAIPSAREHLFIGGKSMGGRIATHVAAADRALPVDGLALLGYPLHPPGRPNQLRDAHLKDVRRPMLIVQGERDAFGTPAELRPVLAPLRPAATLHVVDGGDHSLKVTRSDKAAQATVYDAVQHRIVGWMREVITDSRETGRPPR